MQRHHHVQLNNKGFTLVEGMVAIAILTVLMMGGLSAFVSITDSATRSRLHNEAVNVQSEVLRDVRTTPFSGITADVTFVIPRQIGNASVNFSCRIDVSPFEDGTTAPLINTVARVVHVIVEWPYKGRTYSDTAITLVGNR